MFSFFFQASRNLNFFVGKDIISVFYFDVKLNSSVFNVCFCYFYDDLPNVLTLKVVYQGLEVVGVFGVLIMFGRWENKAPDSSGSSVNRTGGLHTTFYSRNKL